jgi:hypothetical protein
MDRKVWWWLSLAAVILGAFLLRVHDVSRIFLWLDETDFFNEQLYGDAPKSMLSFALATRNATTNTWGWPAVIWLSCHLFGATVTAARAPSVIAGTGSVFLVFMIVYRLNPGKSAALRFPPAIAAAVLAAIAMPQVEFSQRTYPYGAAPVIAAALILAHLKLRRALTDKSAPVRATLGAFILYTFAGAVAVCVHPSLGLLLLASLALLAAGSVRTVAHQTPQVRRRLLGLAAGSVFVLFVMALLNAKNPKYGFRPYLVRYYHAPAIRSIPKLLLHLYDLGTYHLNLFYNESLYWPERANWATLPLIALCVFGWILAWRGRFGESARQLAWFGSLATILPAGLSIFGVFPFGGIRQTLFLSPFLFAFVGLGFYAALSSSLPLRVSAGLVATAWLIMWGINLPRFYSDRLAPYASRELVEAWTENDKLPYYTNGADREIQYLLLAHPEIRVEHLPRESKPPYLLVSTHWPPLENNHMFFGYADYLRQHGYKATLVLEKPPKHLDSLEYSTCLYFPPNGLWIYRVTAQ